MTLLIHFDDEPDRDSNDRDCIHVSYSEQAGGIVICDDCGDDVTFEIFPYVPLDTEYP